MGARARAQVGAGTQAGRARGARGRVGARGAHGWVGARGAHGRARWQVRARAERAGQGWLGAGRAAWPWAVHSVHSACFWPGSTRYFPESKFLDIVREPGS